MEEDPLRQVWLPMLYGKLSASPEVFRREAANARGCGFPTIADDLEHAANDEEVFQAVGEAKAVDR